MMKWIAYGLALMCSALALMLPWAHYGGMSFWLTRIPGWPVYIAGAVVLHACTWWNTVAGRVLAVAGGVIALVTAFVLLLRYDDAAVFFDGPAIPAVVPVMGLGGILAVAGALLNLVLVVTRMSAKSSAESRAHTG
ncbi:hypothetical protein C8D87_111270 [Lentzea atacamensis]|uniref:Uncharacterized protein n=1 Tax=Lentzea atacamensis TaxID=531938 RepID=A0ABX9E1Y4_9PSEU|nr:hypothetical protein [Lentzea atacamensis]RAS60851.1 hypothetical protein C8D87_111270 [Lentzea atacamensis]